VEEEKKVDPLPPPPPPTVDVTVVVQDSAGQPLEGASVRVKGTQRGITTDVNGYAVLKSIPLNSILVISFTGYSNKEVEIGNNKIFTIRLTALAKKLEEIVVVGYGTRLKGELTGAVSKISSEKIAFRPVAGTLDALQGLIPGVTITRLSGQPGNQSYSLSIRGISSLNGSAPLVLVDGIPGDINLLNPDDIDNITVLKDAAAAIYGARAADGVMLITTKRGKKSIKPVITYSYNAASKDPYIMKKPSTTEHFVKMFNDANANDGDPQTFSDSTLAKIARNDPGFGPGENWGVTDYPMFYQNNTWYKDLFQSSLRQTHNLSISGGTDYSTYLISAGYLNDNGNITSGTNYLDRYNLRMSIQSNLRKNIKLDVNISYDNQIVKQPSQLNDAIDNALKAFSYIPFRNPAGNYYTYQGYGNPFQELELGGNEITKNTRLSNNFKLDWEPLKGLIWTGQAGINLTSYNDNSDYATYYGYNWDNTINGLPRNLPNSANYSDNTTLYKNFSTYLNYSKTFGKHGISLMAGASRERFDRNSKYISGADLSSNEIFSLTLSDPQYLSTGDYWDNNSWALLSYFGRLNYSYGGKYYLEGTVRKDGSSKFSPDKRWSGIYPSISAAWKLSEESFFKSIISNNILDLFKTRISWGRTGNQDISAFGLFDYIQQISIGGQYPIDGSTVSRLASLNGIAAPERTWETIESKNLGFDLGFFHSKLKTTFEIYQKENTNMLVSVAYPADLGTTAPTTNAGKLKTKGWDFSGDWNDKVGAVQINIGFVLNYNSNILTNLQGNDTYNEGLTTARQGYPMNSYFGYIGSIIRTQAELDAYAAKYAGKGIVPATQPNGKKGLGVGDVMFQDVDGDGQITPFGDKTKGFNGDAVFLGSADPKYTYSVTGGLKFKNFDFGIILQGTGDKYTWRGNGNFGVPLSVTWFQPLDYFYGKTFSQDNLNSQYPRLSNDGTVKGNNYQFSTIYLVNTKYLRVKNITIGYTVPKLILDKLNLQNARVYLSGQDLFEFSKGTWDKNYDPEEDGGEGNYPMYRTFSCGVSVNF
jgi:TonB-linked SusC/RagA family outer membrane protein